MQQDLLKLALTGLAAGICLSAQGGGSEIAMAKCSRTPAATEDQNKSNPMMNDEDSGDGEMDEESSCSSQGGSCASQQSSCAGSSCGAQGDQSSQNEAPSFRTLMGAKRLSAAKTAMGEESLADMDK